jgi:hypothetical protein
MSTTPPSDLRAAVAALLQWQQAHGHDPLPPAADETALRAGLQAFAAGRGWTTQQEAWWEHCVKLLCENTLAQPHVATQAGRMGALLEDLARLLRGPQEAWDEEQELDAAIRWWEGARKAGFCTEEDFGVLWQQLEWTALLQHLSQLGQDASPALLWAHAVKTATRYIALSPLAALLKEIRGGLMETGFSLR